MAVRMQRKTALWLIVALALAVAASGCGGQASTSSSMKFASVWKGIADATGAAGGLLTISAGGDVNFGDGVTPSLVEGGLDYPFAGVSEAFAATDVSFVNLECCIASVGTPVAGKEFTFRGPSDSAGALSAGNIKVVSMANNHTKDYGAAALVETLGHLKANGIAWCGAGGNSAEAYTPTVLKTHGKRVAFVAFTEVVPDGWQAGASTPGCATTNDPQKVAATIRNARANADYVVASFHWGIELATSPNSEQRNFAHMAVDNGADLVLGHHPHVVQGFEMYKNRLIAYSLGNFVFSPPRAESARSVMVMALLGPGGVVQAKIVPAAITGCRPTILNGEAGNAWASTMSGYSKALGTTMTVTGGRGYISGGTPQPLK